MFSHKISSAALGPCNTNKAAGIGWCLSLCCEEPGAETAWHPDTESQTVNGGLLSQVNPDRVQYLAQLVNVGIKRKWQRQGKEEKKLGPERGLAGFPMQDCTPVFDSADAAGQPQVRPQPDHFVFCVSVQARGGGCQLPVSGSTLIKLHTRPAQTGC